MNKNKEYLILCIKHGKTFENKNIKMEITSELFKCKKCTQNYPIHVNCPIDRYNRFSDYQTKNPLFKAPPNITFKPQKTS
jgi:transcription elongation factor Elf1